MDAYQIHSRWFSELCRKGRLSCNWRYTLKANKDNKHSKNRRLRTVNQLTFICNNFTLLFTENELVSDDLFLIKESMSSSYLGINYQRYLRTSSRREIFASRWLGFRDARENFWQAKWWLTVYVYSDQPQPDIYMLKNQ